jgi:hypothetical protein
MHVRSIYSKRRMIMEKQTYVIEIEGASSAEANRYAEELRDALLGATSEIEVERQRTDTSTQDFGATLVLILGTPAAIVLAKAFRDWINRRKNAKLTWKTPDGEILLENVSAKEAQKIMEFLKSKE